MSCYTFGIETANNEQLLTYFESLGGVDHDTASGDWLDHYDDVKNEIRLRMGARNLA